MSKFFRHTVHWVIAALSVASVTGCAGTTSLQEKHPLIASGTAAENTKVYFIRPDPGFRGVMDRPVTISLGGAELLGLAKGQYALLQLRSGNAEMKVDSYTVAGPANTLTPVSTTAQLALPPGSTLYLVFELVSRGPLAGSAFVPRSVSKDRALETARGLIPIGMAAGEPIQ
jgi:hypothetical protein